MITLIYFYKKINESIIMDNTRSNRTVKCGSMREIAYGLCLYLYGIHNASGNVLTSSSRLFFSLA